MARTAVFLIVAAISLMPLSAGAAAPTGGDADGTTNVGRGENKNGDDESGNDNKGSNDDKGGNDDKGSTDDKGKDPDEPSGKHGDPPGQSQDGASGDDKDKGKDGTSDNGKGALFRDPEPGKPASTHPKGVAVGKGSAPPILTPSGVVPTQGGLGAIDPRSLPVHLGAAVVMFQGGGTAPVVAPPSPTTHSPSGPLSGSLVRALTPVLPPALTNALSAPLVIAEELIEAMAASGQALVVVPLLLGAAGFASSRRRDPFSEALEQE